MLNIFLLYSVVWSVVLILYFFGWSDHLSALSSDLLLFISISIIVSFIFSIFFRDKFKYKELKENPHKKRIIIFFLMLLYILSFLISKSVPLIDVIRGSTIKEISFGMPHFNLFLISFSIVYSVYLSYIYLNFKDKKTLLEIMVIWGYFILTLERQNILICILLFLNILLSKYRMERKANNKLNKKAIRNIVLLIIALFVVLYGFGAIGNYRHGYDFNDSYMISVVGRMNENYPKSIPQEYFWSYVYVTTPLANLNTNVNYLTPQNDAYSSFMLFLPQFIANRLGFSKHAPLLVNKSLTASTAYANIYEYSGFSGMYIMFGVYMLVCAFIIYLCNKKNSDNNVIVQNLLLYFLLFSFFTDTFYYPITALMVLYAFLLSFKFKLKARKY